ncbi:hypothetical protein NMY22_g15333 [Coprinellus aureogranulatus]|nr:hypothetical protein NMY22_g15333 [Coprinellus aureogranulatus]
MSQEVPGDSRGRRVEGLHLPHLRRKRQAGFPHEAGRPPSPTVSASSSPTATPAPAVVTSGEAVKAYREQLNAMEAEDNLKYELKDSVEAKLLAWKKGKETNLRALLASLDTILWDDLIKDMGGKPDMAALITGGGVKKWYMKSVARVHPDKLNANNSTVEQRMIAGGVFGALNEAWLAFKHELAFGVSRPFISLTGDKFAIGTPRTRPRPAGHDGIANDWVWIAALTDSSWFGALDDPQLPTVIQTLSAKLYDMDKFAMNGYRIRAWITVEATFIDRKAPIPHGTPLRSPRLRWRGINCIHQKKPVAVRIRRPFLPSQAKVPRQRIPPVPALVLI